MMRALIGLAVPLFAIGVAGTVSASVPNIFTVQGILRDDQGQLQSTGVKLVVTLFDARDVGSGSTIAGPWGPTDVMAEDGLFSVTIDEPMLRSLLATVPQLWLELKVDGEALPRQRVTAEIYAVLAASAEQADRLSSACSSCVEDAMIKAVAGAKVTGKVESATMADTVANGIYSSGMYVDPAWLTGLSGAKIQGPVPSSLSAVDFTGMLGGDVTGSQGATAVTKLAGSPLGSLGMAKGGDLLGFNGMAWGPVKSYGDMDVLLLLQGAGFLKKGDPIGVNQLPGDGIDKVSNGLVTATVDNTLNSVDTPISNNPNNGIILSSLTVPDIGALKGITVAVNISDADIKGLLIELLAPDGSSVTFYDRSSPGVKDFVKSFDHATMGLPKGTLASYIDKHPNGTWSLKVTSNVVGDNDVLNSWSLRLVALSGTTITVAGDLQVAGNASFSQVNGAKLGSLAGGSKGSALVYDGSKWVPQQIIAPTAIFGGDGSDGALQVNGGTQTVDLGGNQVLIKRYSSIVIAANASVDFMNPHPNGTVVIFKSQGNITITGTLNLRGLGGAGGNQNGNALLGAGAFKDSLPGGSGGPNGSNGLPGNTIALAIGLQLAAKVISITPGSGGGRGGSQDNLAGNGGNGGGALYLECGGSYSFGGTIDARGADGGRGGNPGNSQTASGGGGGGSGGQIIVLYNQLSLNAGTYRIGGGNGGAGGDGQYNNIARVGCGGGAGGSFASQGGTGGAAAAWSPGSPGGNGGGLNGGLGGAGGTIPPPAMFSGTGAAGGGGGGGEGTVFVGQNTYF